MFCIENYLVDGVNAPRFRQRLCFDSYQFTFRRANHPLDYMLESKWMNTHISEKAADFKIRVEQNGEKDMSQLPETLIEIREHNGLDYKPLVDTQSWRVALMNYTPDLTPDKITRMQKHTETDEVFVLMKGRCILFIGEGDENITEVRAMDMELYKLYNVKKGVWHSHTFSEDARVLIVENQDTTDENSPFIGLSKNQCKELVELAKKLWQ